MPGLVPGIHVFAADKDVDGRVKPGHDEDQSVPGSIRRFRTALQTAFRRFAKN
jgi:hypothetical protein